MQASPQRRSSMQCLSWDGYSVYGPSVQRARSNPLVCRMQHIVKFKCGERQGFLQTLVYGVCEMALLPWLYKLAMCCLSQDWKEEFLMPNQTSLLIRTCLEWLSSHLNCLHQPIAQRGWGSTCVYEPYFLEKSRWEIVKGCFPEHRGIGATVPSQVFFFFPCWTQKLPNTCRLCLWIGNSNLIVWTGYMLLVPDKERRICHAPSEFSAKEIMFWMSFLGWQLCVMNQGLESKR